MTDTPKIKPALSAEDWAWNLSPYDDDLPAPLPLATDEGVEMYANPHNIAARALYGQPFGFTREDAENCREAAVRWLMDGFGEFEPIVIQLRSLADRIEALLPPADV